MNRDCLANALEKSRHRGDSKPKVWWRRQGRPSRRVGVLLGLALSCACSKEGREPPAQPIARQKRPPSKLPRRGALTQRVEYATGKKLLAAGKHREAIAAFKRAIAAHQGPELANAYLGLGAAFTAVGQKREAVEAYRQVVKLRPTDGQAHQVLAIGLEEAGELIAAAGVLERAVALAPTRLTGYQDLAALYLALGRQAEAKATYLRYEAQRQRLAAKLKKATRVDEREEAAVALGQARDEASCQALISALNDAESKVRLAAIRALGQQGLPLARRPLQRLLLQQDKTVEREAAQAALQLIESLTTESPSLAGKNER